MHANVWRSFGSDRIEELKLVYWFLSVSIWFQVTVQELYNCTCELSLGFFVLKNWNLFFGRNIFLGVFFQAYLMWHRRWKLWILVVKTLHSNRVPGTISWKLVKIRVYHSMHFFLPFHWPKAHNWMVCSSVVPSKRDILLMCNWNHVLVKKWQIASLSGQEVTKIWKQTWWSNDKTIIELSYRKIIRFISVSQINYLPQPWALANNWSARHW